MVTSQQILSITILILWLSIVGGIKTFQGNGLPIFVFEVNNNPQYRRVIQIRGSNDFNRYDMIILQVWFNQVSYSFHLFLVTSSAVTVVQIINNNE